MNVIISKRFCMRNFKLIPECWLYFIKTVLNLTFWLPQKTIFYCIDPFVFDVRFNFCYERVSDKMTFYILHFTRDKRVCKFPRLSWGLYLLGKWVHHKTKLDIESFLSGPFLYAWREEGILDTFLHEVRREGGAHENESMILLHYMAHVYQIKQGWESMQTKKSSIEILRDLKRYIEIIAFLSC